MALSYPALSATELALLAANKPILGAQTLPKSPTAIWSEVGATGSTDRTLTGYPARRSTDGYAHLYTKPDATASATWYLVFNCLSSPITFDTVAILGHDLFTQGVTGVDLQVADTNDFTGPTLCTIPIATSPSSNFRIIQLSLKHTGSDPLRYTSVPYVRLRLTKGSNFTPSIAELLLIRRRQLKYKPLVPYDPTSLHSNSELVESESGVLSRVTHAQGFRRLKATLRTHETAYQDDLIAWYAQTSYGDRPFFWMESPNSAPTQWRYYMLDDCDFDFPVQAYQTREIEINATEQGPANYFLQNGAY